MKQRLVKNNNESNTELTLLWASDNLIFKIKARCLL